MICPQPEGPALLAVFAGPVVDEPDNDHIENEVLYDGAPLEPAVIFDDEMTARSGHIIIIRQDGTIIPFYRGANYLDPHHEYLEDLNGDGIMDYLGVLGPKLGR